ncbi:hypothetical protein H072_578 [Dactylellina haptotyla CBS 200.50]|uniref:Peptidase S8/S53 domain-containing protein n=1 Tax=Dactylellina haptotyla (strain CBS 200.50) TaxID=1284197 RepID=S8C101_DACHA|nr:hypothetical protein H072_578 [Dactylellina haptotyla CBS 200.50]
MLADHEGRSWTDILPEMGFEVASLNKIHHGYGMTSYEHSNAIRTFGQTMRAFTINMRESDAEAIIDHPSIANLEKTARSEWAVMPRNPHDQPRNLPDKSADMGFKVKRQVGGGGGSSNSTEEEMWVEQSNAPWHLQRVSCSKQVDLKGRLPTDLSYSYRFDQVSGQGVDVYVVDSGINVDHEEFGGRAKMMFSFFGHVKDDIGHGTHCAGTIGSLHYGTAKNVRLWGIKVGDVNGISAGAIVAGIDAAITRHNIRKTQPDFMGSIISMSIGTSPPKSSDFMALKKALDAGMHASVAAMNAGDNACNSSPGGFSQQLPLITVGALDLNDTRASFSNFGKCVDVYAPGVSIVSTFNNNSTGIASLDGTSMACPIVTGIIADELVKNPSLRLDPAGMKKFILSKALKGVIKPAMNMTGVEILANNGFPGDP